jgi:hypothetical protein
LKNVNVSYLDHCNRRINTLFTQVRQSLPAVESHDNRLATLYAHQNTADMEPSTPKTPPLFCLISHFPAILHGESLLLRRRERRMLA